MKTTENGKICRSNDIINIKTSPSINNIFIQIRQKYLKGRLFLIKYKISKLSFFIHNFVAIFFLATKT